MDFLSASDADLEGVPDPEVLAIAADQDRILVSHDFQTMPRRFAEFLQARGSSTPGKPARHGETARAAALSQVLAEIGEGPQ